MDCGDAFLWKDAEASNDKLHLHILISEPCEGQVVLVSITTRRAKSDLMVCLDVGDHKWIKHPSVVAYAYSKLLNVAHLEQSITIGEAFQQPKASASLIQRIQQGMLETDRAPREVQNFFRTVHKVS